jgi:two-component system CheB/CheR fusion protein
LEELKSSNEELVSVNEEMQSTNEELEASKEELQSVNEELHTVNAELNAKIEALDRANSDMQNLFDSTDVATVFLDKNFVIRSFTPAVTSVFNILPNDRGRPITDLSSRIGLANLKDDVAAVFTGHSNVERKVESNDHKEHYLVRLAPYRDSDGQVQGVVITFVDVTSVTRAEAQQRILVAELQHRTRNLLGVVQAIAHRTLPKGQALTNFATRLAALGRVQSLIGGADDMSVDLGEIVRLELQAVGAPDSSKISISGPSVPLSFDRVQTVALALHELATNAIKYGALRDGPGQLKVSWDIRNGTTGPVLELSWRESGVTDMPNLPGKGFGRELIERALSYSSKARAEFTLGRDGVVRRIELPLVPTSSALAENHG